MDRPRFALEVADERVARALVAGGVVVPGIELAADTELELELHCGGRAVLVRARVAYEQLGGAGLEILGLDGDRRERLAAFLTPPIDPAHDEPVVHDQPADELDDAFAAIQEPATDPGVEDDLALAVEGAHQGELAAGHDRRTDPRDHAGFEAHHDPRSAGHRGFAAGPDGSVSGHADFTTGDPRVSRFAAGSDEAAGDAGSGTDHHDHARHDGVSPSHNDDHTGRDVAASHDDDEFGANQDDNALDGHASHDDVGARHDQTGHDETGAGDHEHGTADDDAPVGAETDEATGPHERPSDRRLAANVHERLRRLTMPEQIKVAQTGEIQERIVLERLYGKAVWEALLHNPRLTGPEVARIARMGTLPRVMLELILNNGGWLQIPEVRRALLTCRRLGTDQILRVLRLLPKHELKLACVQTAYPSAVRDAARKLAREG